MGRIQDPWRASDARVRSCPIDCLEIPGATCEAAVANLENVSANHAEAIAAIDMCVVPTLTFDLLFAFLVLGHARRQLLWFEVTRHPTAEWLARQITVGVSLGVGAAVTPPVSPASERLFSPSLSPSAMLSKKTAERSTGSFFGTIDLPAPGLGGFPCLFTTNEKSAGSNSSLMRHKWRWSS